MGKDGASGEVDPVLLVKSVSLIRDASWLNQGRARVYVVLLLGMTLALLAAWVAMARDFVDLVGHPLGTDFISFYAAGRLALTGAASNAWVMAEHAAAQNAVFGRDLGYWAFFYPPPYLLICLPFALLPYGAAVSLWLLSTTGAALVVLHRWAETLTTQPLGWIPLLAFPAIWINVANGQNAALTTALMAAGFMVLPKRPLLAGVILGVMVIKPQLALVLPFALAASGRWRAFFATGFCALGYCVVSYLWVGNDGWLGFLAGSTLARDTLELGYVDMAKMQSLFAGARLWGAPLWLAYGVQAVGAVAAIGVLVVTVRQYRPDAAGLAALTGAATLLVTPFLLDYDLMLLALPLLWLTAGGLRGGFLPWEKSIVLVAYIWPLLARTLAMGLNLPLTPLVVALVLAAVVRRVRTDAHSAAESGC